MTKTISAVQRARQYGAEGVVEIWDSLWKNNLWKRIIKNVTATTTVVAICLIPGTRVSIGRAAYLGAITTVFGHPGRRFGQMAEALILAVSGSALGVAWSTLGIFLGSLVINENPPAAYTIRGLFIAVAAMFHGYLRSRTPRLFIFVLLLIICSVVSLTSTAKKVSSMAVTQILYPILLATGVIIVVNLFIFPEFSSRFLGQTTIETLDETSKALKHAGDYFVGQETLKGSGSMSNKEDSNTLDRSSGESGSSSKRGDVAFTAWFTGGLKKLLGSHNKTTPDIEAAQEKPISVSSLTADKTSIRQKVGNCKSAQSECNFELAFSVLPPGDMKPISVQAMKAFAANVIAVIGACESKYALLGEEVSTKTVGGKEEQDGNEGTPNNETIHQEKNGDQNPPNDHKKEVEQATDEGIGQEKSELDRIRPRREIEFGDARLLQYLHRKIADPYRQLQAVLCRSVDIINTCIAYAYDVPELPSGSRAPKGINLEELDIYIDVLQRAAARFDVDCASALEGAAVIQDIQGLEPDIMPREEIFLISSFVLNVRQAASHIEAMLEHSHELVSRRQQHHGRRRLYAPRIKWASWLTTGGDEEESLPSTGRAPNRKGVSSDKADDEADSQSVSSRKNLLAEQKQKDVEKNSADMSGENSKSQPSKTSKASKEKNSLPKSKTLKIRGMTADVLEWMQQSDDLLYAFKLAISVCLVLWPAFVAKWNTWYSLNRGLWAALQLVFITEVSIGTSVNVFILRAIGTTLGCLWGWAAYEARDGNRIVCAAMICVGMIPFVYIQLGTKYPKAGMVAIVSMCIVALATELETVPGSGTENFLKRYIAFMIGGVVALIVEVAILPVKARTRLVESLASAIDQINEMEKCIAFGIEAGVKIDVFNPATYDQFEIATGKANSALAAAETFLPFCSTEPRLKGSFEALALIYGEIIFVLHQIIDRMENMLQLRTAYGSGPLEELNAEIYPYRRNVAGSVTITLFAIHGALVTKLPLPQFLPSARLSHLRMINRVREVVLEKARRRDDSEEATAKLARQRAVRRKYMAWNASSAAQAEIIEFLEELIDLTKLLVGASEFNSGLLTRESYREYAGAGAGQDGEGDEGENQEGKGKAEAPNIAPPLQMTENDDEHRDQLTDTPSKHPPSGDGGSNILRQRKPTTTAQTGGSSSATADIQLGRRRRGTTLSSSKASKIPSSGAGPGPDTDEEVPASLRRIQTRKLEAGLRRQRTNESSALGSVPSYDRVA